MDWSNPLIYIVPILTFFSGAIYIARWMGDMDRKMEDVKEEIDELKVTVKDVQVDLKDILKRLLDGRS